MHLTLTCRNYILPLFLSNPDIVINYHHQAKWDPIQLLASFIWWQKGVFWKIFPDPLVSIKKTIKQKWLKGVLQVFLTLEIYWTVKIDRLEKLSFPQKTLEVSTLLHFCNFDCISRFAWLPSYVLPNDWGNDFCQDHFLFIRKIEKIRSARVAQSVER